MAVRRRMDWSQAAAAHFLGIGSATVQRAESGTVEPMRLTRRLISLVFRLTKNSDGRKRIQAYKDIEDLLEEVRF